MAPKKQYSFSLTKVDIDLIDQCREKLSNTRSGFLRVILHKYLDSLTEDEKNQIKIDF